MRRSRDPLTVTCWDRNRFGGDLKPWRSTSMPGAPDCDVTAQQETSGASYARHQRRAPLARQMVIAIVAGALDGVACYFAARALGGGRGDIMLWTCLFLAGLSAGLVTLGLCRKRSERAWRALAIMLGPVVTLLGTRGKRLVWASSPHAMAAAPSASRSAAPRSSPAVIAAIVTALAAAARVTAIWDTVQCWPQMHLQEG
jgi:hypothetical protein